MKALKGFVIVECLDQDMNQTSGGIYIQQKEKPNVGHYKVVSVSDNEENSEIKVGDTIWALTVNVSKSSNFNNDNLGIVKYVNVMSVD